MPQVTISLRREGGPCVASLPARLVWVHPSQDSWQHHLQLRREGSCVFVWVATRIAIVVSGHQCLSALLRRAGWRCTASTNCACLTLTVHPVWLVPCAFGHSCFAPCLLLLYSRSVPPLVLRPANGALRIVVRSSLLVLRPN